MVRDWVGGSAIIAPMGDLAASDINHAHPEHLLGLAVERVYAAFASHSLGAAMPVWRQDVTASDVAALSGPVRDVDPEAIDRWLPHAVTTWGTADDLRALLPRVLELFAAGRLSTSPEVLFTKVRLAGVTSWTVEEQAAVEDLITAVWLAGLAAHPSASGHPAWRLLVGLAELGDELSPFLDDWLLMLGSAAPERATARHHLRDLVAAVERHKAAGGGVASLFWTPRPTEVARLETWLASPFTTSQLADAP
jgi:hypothetical protein